MDTSAPGTAVPVSGSGTSETEEFVRFCYGRRPVGWPDLYDEMCSVASRGAFRGWSFVDLADHGICFTLFDLPRLAAIAERVAHESPTGDSRDGRGLELAGLAAAG
jgi:hypothetical protein